ncbi:hypothetical protein, conserved in T. vivax, partial [Trypanosoma vivax Y486]
MALFFRCIFLVALLGAAALGDKGTGSVGTKRTDSRFDVLPRHRETKEYPKIRPRSPLVPVPGSESNTSSGVPAAPPADGSESTSPDTSTVSRPVSGSKQATECNCSEEEKEECESKCKNKEIKSASPSKSRSKSKSKSMEKNEVSHPVPPKPEGQLQQEGQDNVQGEAQQGLENGSESTGKKLPEASSPASGSGSPETPKSKPAAEQVGDSLSENRPGKEKEHAAPQNSDKQLDSTNNGESAKDNVDKTESNGDASDKEKAENNDEEKGGRDGWESSIASNEGRSGKDGSAETSSANFSGK